MNGANGDGAGAAHRGRVWLITGAASGFGRAIAEAALDGGDVVAATARAGNALDDLIARDPSRAVALELDVTDAARIPDVVEDVVRSRGRIDVLVNNAGRGHVGALEETDERELRELMEAHFFGPAALTRAVLPHMRRQGSGAIVQMSSLGGRLSFAGFSAYSASKFALEGLSEALALEVNPLGIKVLIVEPGNFRTGLLGRSLRQSAAMPAYADSVGPTRAMITEQDGRQPGDPAKAAAAIVAAIDADDIPRRLALGSDAVDALLTAVDRQREELVTWEAHSRRTDFEPQRQQAS
jgi:NAD(P)-dependent dehydrogenase (short-subunit alcohol dehydrogenase family)